MKTIIFIGITVGGLLFGWIGTMLDGGNGLGGWSLLLGGFIGPFVGLWVGYKIGKNLGE